MRPALRWRPLHSPIFGLLPYHSRFGDLPTSVKLHQLRLWERPPISESAVAPWLHLGFASVYQRLQDLDSCVRRLELAKAGIASAGTSAQLEAMLLEARLKTGAGQRGAASQLFDQAQQLLKADDLSHEDRLCYTARLAGQRAFHLTKPLPGAQANYLEARTLFEAIEEDELLPFVSFRKFGGLAYCTWRLGDIPEGVRLAKLASDYAADAGLVRFRVMALGMLSKMLPDDEAKTMRMRAERLSRQLEDEDLLARVARLNERANSR